MDFTSYRSQLLQQREGEIALLDLVRNFSQWFFDLLRNFVLVGGLKYFAEKSGSTVLFYLHEFALLVILAYCLSYADQWYINLFSFLENKRVAHWLNMAVNFGCRCVAVPGIHRAVSDHRRRNFPRASLRPRSGAGLARRLGGEAKILDQKIELAPLVALFLQPQQIRRMHGDQALAAAGRAMSRPRLALMASALRISPRAAVAPSATATAGRTTSSSLSSHQRQASISLVSGFLCSAPLAARLVLEVLHGVGDVDVRAVDARRLERAVEHLARGADEGAPGKILLVARLLADQHQGRIGRAFAEHGLGGVLVKVAARAGSASAASA